MTKPVTYVNPPAETVLRQMEKLLPVHPFTVLCEGEDTIQNWGISLRDYFAGQAVAAVIARMDHLGYPPKNPHAHAAATAYAIADAMLAERERKP